MNDICCTGRRASAAACSALSVVCLGAFFSLPAQAVEQGATITPIGITDFGAGMLPPSSPFGTVGVRASYYSASTLKDGAGKSIPNDFHIDVKTLALAYFYMTDVEVLGARFGVASTLPAPALGQHSDELLAVLGHNQAEIAAMRAAGVI